MLRFIKNLQRPLHWLPAVLILQGGIVLLAWLLANPSQAPYSRPMWVWWGVLTLLVGCLPFLMRRRHRFTLKALLVAGVAGGVVALLARYWVAKSASWIWLVMLVALFSFATVGSEES